MKISDATVGAMSGSFFCEFSEFSINIIMRLYNMAFHLSHQVNDASADVIFFIRLMVFILRS